MAINPATAKVIAKIALSAATDEEARKKLLIAILIPFITVLIILCLFVYILTSPFSFILKFFISGSDRAAVEQYKVQYCDMFMLQKGNLVFNGKYPMPAAGDIVSPYGMRIHPVSGEYKMHTGIDINTDWHCPVMSVADGQVVKIGISNETHDFTRRYVWLMLFDDGNRVDLGIEIKEEAVENYLDDKLTVLLLDKDNLLPEIPPPSDEDYCIKKPTEDGYVACCNEFWWCLNNVAKGIARDELPYAMEMFCHYVRDMLNQMVEWFIGSQTNFSVSAGKMGKYFKRYLPPELYAQYTATYSGSDYADIWEAVDVMCDLFHTLALVVAAYFDSTYRQEEEDGMREYLRMVKEHVL